MQAHAAITRRSLYFTAPGEVRIREEAIPAAPTSEHLLMQSVASAVSPGTELLFFQGQIPPDLQLDASIAALGAEARYPFKYGYCMIARPAHGVQVPSAASHFFAFHPHESHFYAAPAALFPVPADLAVEQALFLPNMETAVNFLLDGAPLIGERVAVIGQGVVGLLTTSLLARLPLDHLLTVDRLAERRRLSAELGASLSAAAHDLDRTEMGAYDLVYEVSGNPAALDLALQLAGTEGRIVVGSWYGEKRAPVNLGGRFHRERLRLISSQVSTLAAVHSARWTKVRRLETAWAMLQSRSLMHLITHRIPFDQAADAYALIHGAPQATLQVIFDYTTQ